MITLYFSNIPTIISTALVIGIWTYIIRTMRMRLNSQQIDNMRNRCEAPEERVICLQRN
ncbi:hypothetical protein [Lachnoclostridium phytofermentans]|uniref:hypothetical protein n=1 Tax=Lachnoclostridium phytofermentans TaxID=66219 RepID=UPI0012FB1104|nr:hypothetical protein [Lachnoclostridium phytofermentans]